MIVSETSLSTPLPIVHIALVNPLIPQNTGGTARVTAAFKVPLHIVGEPAFSLDEKRVRRAGLDYWDKVDLHRHESIWELLAGREESRVVLFTTRGTTPLSQMTFRDGDVLVFGNETDGLPEEIHENFGAHAVKIDQTDNVRSINLANAVAIGLFEALRQIRFDGHPTRIPNHRVEDPLGPRSVR